MPAIAAGAEKDGAQFYWHLGDLRAINNFDEDMLDHRKKAGFNSPLAIGDYERMAWDDFIQNQIGSFSIPFFLGIGNHEVYPPKNRDQFLVQFADWLDSQELRAQRLADDPKDHRLKAYYHFQKVVSASVKIDFVFLDNATPDQLDADQLRWLEQVLARDASDAALKTVVIGMHEALPDSLAVGHSMSDFPVAQQTGRQVYADLLKLRGIRHKHVYVLASHAHFYMAGIFNSDYWRAHGGVLPGWIVGTAGAVRFALPPQAKQAEAAKTNIYGYLLGTLMMDGTIKFEFHEVKERDVPAAVAAQYTAAGLYFCFAQNVVAQ
jgi:hypothetical protein